MSTIITPAELHHLGLDELSALFNKVSAELVQTAPLSQARRDALASLDNIQRAMAHRLAHPRPKPPGF